MSNNSINPQREVFKVFNNYPEILTPRDLMEMLNLSKTTVYAMLNNHIIPAYRVGCGKKWRINKCDLEEYLRFEKSYW